MPAGREPVRLRRQAHRVPHGLGGALGAQHDGHRRGRRTADGGGAEERDGTRAEHGHEKTNLAPACHEAEPYAGLT